MGVEGAVAGQEAGDGGASPEDEDDGAEHGDAVAE